jgi:hypothetical protein
VNVEIRKGLGIASLCNLAREWVGKRSADLSESIVCDGTRSKPA